MRPEARIALGTYLSVPKMIARLDFRSAILDFVISESLNLVIETLDQLSHVLKCLEAVPVTDAFHDL